MTYMAYFKAHQTTQNSRFKSLTTVLTIWTVITPFLLESFGNAFSSNFSQSDYEIEYERRILITGVSGLIGRILFHHFINNYSKKYYVIGTDQHTKLSPRYQFENRSAPNQQILEIPHNRFFMCDITDYECLNRIIRKHRIETVIHLAAVLELDLDPEKIHRVNFEGTKNILLAPQPERIIFASSVMVAFGYVHDYSRYSIVDNSFDSGRIVRNLVELNIPDHLLKPELHTSSLSAYCQSKINAEHIANRIVEMNPSRSVITARLGWVNIHDDPGFHWSRTIWLSHQDLIQFFEKAIQSPMNITGTYYVLSNNHGRWLDISPSKRNLGYIPRLGARPF